MTKYALFDWDNTLRKGFTVGDWIQYLSVKQIVDQESYAEFLFQFELFEKQRISYQQLSDNTTSIYANVIAGKKVSLLENIGKSFCHQDGAVFPFVGELFRKFRERNIEIIVISGTPQMLLKQYSELLGIHEVYGMVIGTDADCFTNIIEKDYGAYKEGIVKDICISKGALPIFALGDSVADKPLIDRAEYGCYVDKRTGNISLGEKIIGSVSSACDAIMNLGI